MDVDCDVHVSEKDLRTAGIRNKTVIRPGDAWAKYERNACRGYYKPRCWKDQTKTRKQYQRHDRCRTSKSTYRQSIRRNSDENVTKGGAGAMLPQAKGTFTFCYDETGNELHVGQKVELLGQEGEIAFEAGAYGISFDRPIDWNAIESAIKTTTGTRNNLLACQNDNFVSLWELIWNFNAEDDVIPNLKLMGD